MKYSAWRSNCLKVGLLLIINSWREFHAVFCHPDFERKMQMCGYRYKHIDKCSLQWSMLLFTGERNMFHGQSYFAQNKPDFNVILQCPQTGQKGNSRQPYLEGPSYRGSSTEGGTGPRSSSPVEGDRRRDRTRGACCNSHLIKYILEKLAQIFLPKYIQLVPSFSGLCRSVR